MHELNIQIRDLRLSSQVEELPTPDVIANTAKILSSDTFATLSSGRLSFTKNSRKLTQDTVESLVEKKTGIYYVEAGYKAFVELIFRLVWVDLDAEEVPEEEIIQLEMPQSIKDVIKPYICWASLSRIPKVMIRSDSNSNSWELCGEHPINDLLDVAKDNTTVGDELIKQISEIQTTTNTTWGAIAKKNAPKKIMKLLDPKMGKIIKDGILSERDMRLDGFCDFTNDIEKPSLACFPLIGGKKKGNCEHWLFFETQFRPEDVEVWRAAFAGIFDARNRSRQIIYLVGDGQGGRSNLFNAIEKVTKGKFSATVGKEGLNGPFWAAPLYGKRLIYVPDTGNPRLLETSNLKQLTGKDPISVEFKNETPFKWHPNVRVVISSNVMPQVDITDKAQVSRLLLFQQNPVDKNHPMMKKICHLDSEGNILLFPDGKPQYAGVPYDEWQAEEFYDYLELCQESYNRLCPAHGDVRMTDSMFNSIKDICTTDVLDNLEFFLDSYCEITTDVDDFISNADLNVIFNKLKAETPDLKLEQLTGLLRVKFKCPRESKKIDGRTYRGFTKVKLREGVTIKGDSVFFSDRVKLKAEKPNLDYKRLPPKKLP